MADSFGNSDYVPTNDSRHKDSKLRHRPIRSCLTCHWAKRKCDRGRPCQRCSRLGGSTPCTYEADIGSDGHSGETFVIARRSSKSSRSKDKGLAGPSKSASINPQTGNVAHRRSERVIAKMEDESHSSEPTENQRRQQRRQQSILSSSFPIQSSGHSAPNPAIERSMTPSVCGQDVKTEEIEYGIPSWLSCPAEEQLSFDINPYDVATQLSTYAAEKSELQLPLGCLDYDLELLGSSGSRQLSPATTTSDPSPITPLLSYPWSPFISRTTETDHYINIALYSQTATELMSV